MSALVEASSAESVFARRRALARGHEDEGGRQHAAEDRVRARVLRKSRQEPVLHDVGNVVHGRVADERDH